MRLVALFAAALAILPVSGAPLAAEERLPDCTDQSVGIACVERRDQIGPWGLEEVVPPVGSQNALILSTPSFDAVPGIFGREEPALLVLSCIENVTRFEVRFGENFMSDVGTFGRLVYRVDDAAPVAIEAVAAEDNFALGLYTGAEAIPLIRSMSGADRLLVSATSFTGRTITASFSIDGIDDAVAPLRALCNW